jgi:hypothetical protein
MLISIIFYFFLCYSLIEPYIFSAGFPEISLHFYLADIIDHTRKSAKALSAPYILADRAHHVFYQ